MYAIPEARPWRKAKLRFRPKSASLFERGKIAARFVLRRLFERDCKVPGLLSRRTYGPWVATTTLFACSFSAEAGFTNPALRVRTVS